MKLHDEKVTTYLHSGQLGLIPTDTVVCVVADASNASAVAALYALTGKKSGTILAASIEQLVELGLKERYLKPVADYWPNPIDIIVPTGPSLPYIHQGTWLAAVRIPKNESLQALLQAVGPLLAVECPKPTAAITKGVSFEIKAGSAKQELSTVIRIVDDMVEVQREGAVKLNESGEIIS